MKYRKIVCISFNEILPYTSLFTWRGFTYKKVFNLTCLTLSWQGPYYIETIPLICFTNQKIGVYIIDTSVMKELIRWYPLPFP